MKIDRNCKEAYCNKGISLDNLEKYEEAIKCFNKAIQIDSNYKEAYKNKGNTLDKLGKYDEAKEC
jgi:tetratricopeptide (TPR) repeat protein